jgi:hypothetical protein
MKRYVRVYPTLNNKAEKPVIIVLENTNKIPTKYQQNTNKLPTKYQQNTNKIPTKYQQNTTKIPTKYQQNTLL